MEIRDPDNPPRNGDPTDAPADPTAAQSRERGDGARDAPQPDATNPRAALFARLRGIIAGATEAIRALKAENAALAARNAAMEERIVTLEYRIRAVTANLANDELALRRAAETLEQALQSPSPAAPETAPSEPQSADPSDGAAPIPTAPETDRTEPRPATEGLAVAPEPETISPPPVGGEADAGEAADPASRPTAQPDIAYTVIAHPFVRFSDLGQFQAALQALGGVHDVQVRRFAQGTLEMRIGYTGTTDLAAALRDLTDEVVEVREEEPDRLRVRLRASRDAEARDRAIPSE